jgi:K+-sensing histidine kinase KdpD
LDPLLAETMHSTVLWRRSCLAVVFPLALVLIATGIIAEFAPPVRHLVFAYVVPVALAAGISGSSSVFLASVASVLAGAYCFYAPRFSIYVSDPLDVAELAFFLLFSLLGGFAISRILAR